MSKMTAPKMDVIRFNESDVIVASIGGKTITIDGLGNKIANDATFIIGDGDPWTSRQVNSNSAFTTALNEYLGGNYFSNNDEIIVGFYEDGSFLGNRITYYASHDMVNDTSGYVSRNLNGILEWNSSTNRFLRRQQ